jgi:aminoglycoside 3-N-acetyltransferase
MLLIGLVVLKIYNRKDFDMSDMAKNLADQFAKLGLRKGSVCVAHSSFKSLGLTSGYIKDVIDGLLLALGLNGTLIMPTHTGYDEIFNWKTTPSKTGSLTEVLRTQFHSIRSKHPSHSCCAIGRKAREAVLKHENNYGFGSGSPYEFVYKQSGQVLLIGAELDVVTNVHLAEFYAEMPYLRQRSCKVMTDNGHIVTVCLEKQSGGHSDGFVKLEPELRNLNAIRYGMVEQAQCKLLDAKITVDTAVAQLRQNPTFLLCDDKNCILCNKCREMIRGGHRLC